MSPEHNLTHIKMLGGARITLYEGESPTLYRIDNIKDDMDGENLLEIFIRSDKDAFLKMSNLKNDIEISIGFASLTGGPRISPVISEELCKLADLLVNNDGKMPLVLPHDLSKQLPESKEVRGMKIDVYSKGDTLYRITDIKGDQGHNTSMSILITENEDAIISLMDEETKQILEMHFNGRGSRFPSIPEKFKDLAFKLSLLENF